MKYFRTETKESKFNLYPFVCWHLGSPQADIAFIKDMISRVDEDPYGKWIYLGDAGECVTRYSKGDIFSQTLSPVQQQNELESLLRPIRNKGLFGVRGNHGNRIYKETGLDFDETLCAKLGIPYLGTAAFWHLKVKDVYFSIYAHHGADSGVNVGTKVNKAKIFENMVDADAILTAHSHVCMDLPPRYMAHLTDRATVGESIKWTETREYICGSAYDSRTGYAEDKGYPPLLPSHMKIEFSTYKDSNGSRRKQQVATIFRKQDY